VPAGRVVSSDLRRARHTARPVARALGLAVVVDPRLREVDVGSWEGLTQAEAAEAFPEDYAAWRAGEEVARGGGESTPEAGARAAAAMVDHAADLDGEQVLIVVSHGLVLNAALRRLRADGVADFDDEPPRLTNAAWFDVALRI
jgi:broad specificity phosphatase PhoE